jgi:hypothetical protein
LILRLLFLPARILGTGARYGWAIFVWGALVVAVMWALGVLG